MASRWRRGRGCRRPGRGPDTSSSLLLEVRGEVAATKPPRPGDEGLHATDGVEGAGTGGSLRWPAMPPLTVALHAGQLLQPVPGGIGRYVRALLAALPGVGVTPLAFAAGPRPDDLEGPWADLGPPRGPARYELWHRLRRPHVRAAGDVLHATSLAVPPPGGRPLVVTVHDLVFLRQPEHLTPRGVAFHRRGLDLARRDAAAVVVPTAWGRDDLLGEGFAADRVHVAHHGCTSARPRPAATLRCSDGSACGTPFVLFASTIEPSKGRRRPGRRPRCGARRTPRPRPAAGDGGAGRVGVSRPDLDRPGVVVLGRWATPSSRCCTASAGPRPPRPLRGASGCRWPRPWARGCPVVTTDAACLPEVAGGAADLVPVGDVEALGAALLRWSRTRGPPGGAERAGGGHGPSLHLGCQRPRPRRRSMPPQRRTPAPSGGGVTVSGVGVPPRPQAGVRHVAPGPAGTGRQRRDRRPGSAAGGARRVRHPGRPAGAGMYVVELVRALAAVRRRDLSWWPGGTTTPGGGRSHLRRRSRPSPPATALRLAWEQAWPLASPPRRPGGVARPHYTLPCCCAGRRW
jgi:hypothetical protein